MGYRKVPTIHPIEVDKHDGLIVRMKSMTVGKMRRLIRDLDDDKKTTDQVIDVMVTALLEGAVSWNLTDEEDQPIPLNREELEELEFPMLTAIVESWLDVVSGPDKELGKGSSSGETFPGQPLTMEAL